MEALVPAVEATPEAAVAAAEVVEAEEADQPPEDKKKRFRALFFINFIKTLRISKFFSTFAPKMS